MGEAQWLRLSVPPAARQHPAYGGRQVYFMTYGYKDRSGAFSRAYHRAYYFVTVL